MIRGAIFDVDGTLLDSMSIWDTIAEDYLRSLGIQPKENLKKTFQSFTLYQSACYYRDHYGVTLSVDEIIDGITQMIANAYINRIPVKPGAADFLIKLRNHGIKMCIATASDRSLVEAALKRCKIIEFFTEIVTCTQVGKGKENPLIYRVAQKILGTDKRETVVFEDTVYALKTAKMDGFLTAAIYDLHENNQEEMQTISHFYLKDFSHADSFLRSIRSKP